jgi:hypothetical protein
LPLQHLLNFTESAQRPELGSKLANSGVFRDAAAYVLFESLDRALSRIRGRGRLAKSIFHKC